MQIAFVVVLVAMGLSGVGEERSLVAYGVMLILCIVLYAGGEALGSVAFKQTIRALGDGRDSMVQTSLFNWQYSLSNLAMAAGGSLVPFLWRWVFAEDNMPIWFAAQWDTERWPVYLTGIALRIANSGQRGANVAILVSAAISWTLTTLLMQSYHRYLTLILPDAYPPSKEAVDAFIDHRSYRELWARHKHRLGHSGLQLWVLVMCLIMFGIMALFTDLALVLPKYLMFRHGQVIWWPLFTAINPLLITVLAPLVPVVLGLLRVGNEDTTIINLLIIGATIQGTSPIWATAWPTMSGIVAFLVQSTIGEAIVMPQLGDYHLRLVGKDLLAYSHAIIQLPYLVVVLVQTLLSGKLLDTFCANAQQCGDGASMLWLAVAVLALTTPIGFIVLRVAMYRNRQNVEYEKI
jgi:hypothetical protein